MVACCRHDPVRFPASNSRLMRRVWPYFLACLLGTAPAGADERVQFNRDVRPILSDKCFHCHGPDAKKRQAELRLDVRDAAVAAGALAPGKPDRSALLRRIVSDDPEERMPPAAAKLGRLSPQEVQTLRRWIEQGAEYESHWAFIPLAPVTVPGHARQSPIDVLVEGQLA